MPNFLQQAKNIVNGKSPDAVTPIAQDNRIDRIDQCKVIWYQWDTELKDDPDAFTKLQIPVPASVIGSARAYDISNHIASVSFSKAIGEGAGNFSIILENSFDWSRYMKAGHWIAIYMNGDGALPYPTESNNVDTSNLKGLSSFAKSAKSLISNLAGPVLGNLGGLQPVPGLPLPTYNPDAKAAEAIRPFLRCVGVIQRPAIRSTMTVDGARDITYVISGKDFGVVYEETELWFNFNSADQVFYTNLIKSITKNYDRLLGSLMEQWHDIFLNPKKLLKKNVLSQLTLPGGSFFPEQWVLPKPLIEHLGLIIDGEGYFGDIVGLKEFSPTIFENPTPDPLAGMQGFCWDKLREISEPIFHELFTELSEDGYPKLFFRPLPWALNKSKYPTLGSTILNYADLTKEGEVLPPIPLNLDLGKITSLDSLTKIAKSAVSGITNSSQRTRHRVPVTSAEITDYDLAPSNHERFNFFLVDSNRSTQDQLNAFALAAQNPTVKFPLRDENDIKRHGFKPSKHEINTFLIKSKDFFGKDLYGNSPEQKFILEANSLLADYHAKSDDFYSGTMILCGKPEIKLGKIIITDNDLVGVPNMVFYIQGYTDTFTVNTDKTTSWMQTLQLVRGMELEDLRTLATKDKKPITKSGDFIADNREKSNGTTLGKVKNLIKKPF